MSQPASLTADPLGEALTKICQTLDTSESDPRMMAAMLVEIIELAANGLADAALVEAA